VTDFRRTLLTASFFVVLVALVYSDPLFLRRNFGGGDLLGYHLPIEKAVHDAYARGRWPLWIGEISGGRPLLANINVGALYPIRPLLSPISFPTAMRIFPLLHWMLGGIGVMALLSSIGSSSGAMWLGAATYVFSGVSVSEVFYTNDHPGVMLLPWIVWAMTQSAWSERKRVVVLSLLLGLDFLAGDVFTVGMALLACLLWVLVERTRLRVGREVGVLAGALALSALFALPQLLATALWAPHTHRAISGFSLGESLELSLSAHRLFELLIPFPFGDVWRAEPGAVWAYAVAGRPIGFFSTLYAGALAPIALISLWRSDQRAARFARVLFILGLALALPGSFLPERMKSWRSPLPLRHPEKFALLIALALAICAAMGWEKLRASPGAPRWALAVGVGLAAMAVWARWAPMAVGRLAVFAAGTDPGAAEIAATRLGPALAEGALLWMVTVVAWDVGARRNPAAALAALAVLTAIPLAANRRIARTYSQEEIFAPTPFARSVQRADPDGAFRTLAIPSSLTAGAVWSGQDVGGLENWRRSWLYFTPTLWRRGTVFNQDADLGDLERTEIVRRLGTRAAGYTDSAAFFGSLALRFAIRFKDEPARAGYHRVGGDSIQDWDEHERPYPDLRLLSSWQEVSTAADALRALPRLRPGEVVLESGSTESSAAPEGILRILERSPERLRLETESSAPTWLFVLRGYFPFRKVLVDGRPTEVFPAQIAFSAARIQAGRHVVEWIEERPGGRGVWAGPVAFVLLSAALLTMRSRRGSGVR
jgi:hypothetical protein